MLRTVLSTLVRVLPKPRVITEADHTPYLSRWYLLGGDRDDPALSWLPFNVFLHKFHQSDADDELHSHPWTWGLSLILVGGYSEEYRTSENQVRRRTLKPGSLNYLKATTFHRVDLLDEDAWTLFIAGPRTPEGSWWFWDRHTDTTLPWQVWLRIKEVTAAARERAQSGVDDVVWFIG